MPAPAPSPREGGGDPGLEQRIGELEEALSRAGVAERPVAVLDQDAFDHNLEDMVRRAAGTPIRIASKSLRVRALLDRALEHPGCHGVLAFTLAEALWLAENGHEDVVVGYPTVDRPALEQLASQDVLRERVTLMVDEIAHLDLLADILAGRALHGRPLRVTLDLDVAYAPGAGVRFGAFRSPVFRPEQAAELAREIGRRPGLRLVGMMAYEGQIAGVGDAAPGPYGLAVRTMQRLSAREIATRRAAAVAAVRAEAELEFVNGGGTGSLETTGGEDAVTEVAAGSGLIGPGLFDHYRRFTPSPALLLGFPVVRRPAPRIATLLGGGWIASGPAGTDRLPTLAHPPGLDYAPQEGPGEVQTPVRGAAADGLRIGDLVWLRHAKAGEPAEHVPHYHVVAGQDHAGTIPTYRGEGQVFL